jgi:hypothetical protein
MGKESPATREPAFNRDPIREGVTAGEAGLAPRQPLPRRYRPPWLPLQVGEDGALVPDDTEQALIARALRAEGDTLRAIQVVLETQYGRKMSLDALHRAPAEQRPE